MTTTPSPTETEHELALHNARALVRPVADHAVPHDPIRVMLATALLDLHAQLAESERAREAYMYALTEIRDELPRGSWARETAQNALAADQTTVRESAENTAEETTVDEHVNQEECEHPTLDTDCVCKACGLALGLSREQIAAREPAPAKPPEPVEPSDAWLEGLYLRNPKGIDYPDNHRKSLRRVYRAGLAAEAAAHEETKADAERQYIARSGAEHELERVRAELNSMQKARDAWCDTAQRHHEARERAEHELSLRAQARARRVPTREELRRVIRDELRHPVPASDNRTASEACADAVLRLFAEAPSLDTDALALRIAHSFGTVPADWQFEDLSLEGRGYWRTVARAAMTALGFQDSQGASPEGRTDDRTDRDPIHRGATPDNDRLGQPGPDDAQARADEHDQSSSERAEDAGAEHRGHEARGSVPLGGAGPGDGPELAERLKLLESRVEDIASGAFGDIAELRRLCPGYREQATAQPEPLVTSDNEPPVPLPRILLPGARSLDGDDLSGWVLRYELDDSTKLYVSPTGSPPRAFKLNHIDWSHYHAQQRAAEPTPGTVLGTARVVRGGKVEPREVEAPDAPEDRYVPTVGERAVLVASPDAGDHHLIGRVLLVKGAAVTPHPCSHWLVEDENPDSCDETEFTVHRDATWRPASAAPAKGERFAARVELAGELPVTVMATSESDSASPQPGGFLDAVNAKLAHLEGKTQGMAEGTAGEFRRVDATLRAHSERVERIERAMDSELAAYDMRSEREERERSVK